MDQLQNCFQPDILGLPHISLLPPPTGSPHNAHAKLIKVGEKSLNHAISEEEMKIRREIEREIERDLEEEIKGGIYQQALRLRRLYQHRIKSGDINPPVKTKKELLEVNISIKMEGGTKMEIKDPPPPVSFRRRTARSDTASRTVPEVKRLDWVKSLRSSAAPPVVGKNVGFYRNKMPPVPTHYQPNYSFKRF
ncbi:uncharacterized protein LOC111781225 [Cucurbita pepo subsp. pepo]|uniref:uncharacterized protein LOC111781225 n=1 Tax=Cucurbita pepo subsp. pepo TaxID=3664 RepID=UPI000C9D6BB8|nr:uncharacterized protein LOC111781225 [Cucurbita pepo subsp. pepo]